MFWALLWYMNLVSNCCFRLKTYHFLKNGVCICIQSYDRVEWRIRLFRQAVVCEGREGGRGAPEKGKKAKKRSDKNGGKRRGKCWEVPLQIMIVLTGKKRRRRKGKKRWRWCLACAPSVEASYLRGRNIFLSEKKSVLLFFLLFPKFYGLFSSSSEFIF